LRKKTTRRTPLTTKPNKVIAKAKMMYSILAWIKTVQTLFSPAEKRRNKSAAVPKTTAPIIQIFFEAFRINIRLP
jgi:hypothetical protein